jgi:hypothetical protein
LSTRLAGTCATTSTPNNPDALDSRLADHGVQADVTHVPYGEHCQPDRYELSPTQHQVGVDNPTPAGVPLNMNDVELSFTLRPADFQPDETLVVAKEWAGADTDPPKAGAVSCSSWCTSSPRSGRSSRASSKPTRSEGS